MKRFPIIFLAGYSGAGKSTIGSNFCKKYGLDFIEHQKLVHDISISKGFERARHWLREVGVDQFSKESVEGMLKIVRGLEGTTRGVLTDVAYGKEMIQAFKNTFPGKELIIGSVFANQRTRETRIGVRMGGVERDIAQQEREFRDEFLSKVGLQEILESADFVIENTGTIPEAVEELRAKLSERGWNFEI